MKCLSLFFYSILLLSKSTFATPMYFCTASDTKYFHSLQQLIGSIHKTNFHNTVEIAVFDLGLHKSERQWLEKIAKVKLFQIKSGNKDILRQFTTSGIKQVPGWYAWKPVAIKQVLKKYPYVLWIDAGNVVLHPLDNLFNHIATRGYFLVTIPDMEPPCHFIGRRVTSYVKKQFHLDSSNSWILDAKYLDASFVGVAKSHEDLFLREWYECTKDMRYFEDDGSAPMGKGAARHDQTLLSIIAHKNKAFMFYSKDHDYEVAQLCNDALFVRTCVPNCMNDDVDVYHCRGNLPPTGSCINSVIFK